MSKQIMNISRLILQLWNDITPSSCNTTHKLLIICFVIALYDYFFIDYLKPQAYWIAYSKSAASLPATTPITLQTVFKCGKLMGDDPSYNSSDNLWSSIKKVAAEGNFKTTYV